MFYCHSDYTYLYPRFRGVGEGVLQASYRPCLMAETQPFFGGPLRDRHYLNVKGQNYFIINRLQTVSGTQRVNS